VPPAEAAPPPPRKAECEQAGPPLGEATLRPLHEGQHNNRSRAPAGEAALRPLRDGAHDRRRRPACPSPPRMSVAAYAAAAEPRLVRWGERLIRGSLVFFLLCLQILYFLNHLFYPYLTDIQSRGKRRIRFKITRAKSQSLKNKDKITVGLLEKGNNTIFPLFN